MRKRSFLFCVLAVILMRSGSSSADVSKRDAPEFTVLTSDNFRTEVLIELGEPRIEAVDEGGETFHTVRLSGTGWSIQAGRPELPVLARLMAVPPGVSVDVEVVRADFTTVRDIRVRPNREAGVEGKSGDVIDNALYGRDDLYPERVAEVGSPAWMGGLCLIPLIVHPVQYNPVREELKVYGNMTLTLTYSGGGVSDLRPPKGGRSEAFERLYRSSVVNYRSDESQVERGGYLIVTPDVYYDALGPLVEWKRHKGHHVDVVRLSQIGTHPDNNQIRNYIQNYYSNASVPLEYVTLVGDVAELPTFFYYDEMEGEWNPNWPWDAADHPYCMLEGDDYFPEVFIGRLSVSSVYELQTVVNKIVSYERDPYMGQTDWYRRALMVCNYGGTATARTTKLWVRDKLMEHGFSQVDTSFMLESECDVGFIQTVVNAGVSFLNYRGFIGWGGWTFPPDFQNIYYLQNGYMLPVVTDMTCSEAAFYGDCAAEVWLRAGTVMSPRGGIAAIGPSAGNTKVYFNNVLDGGFYAGVFDDSLFTVGQALARAKMELYMQYPLNRGPGHAFNSVECYFYMYTLIGDPGLEMWTDIPQFLTVEHPSVIEVGSNVLEVRVRDSSHHPVGRAYVCLTEGGEIRSGGFTGSDGEVRLPVSPQAGGAMTVTVTKHNYRPYQALVIGEEAPVSMALSDYAIDDDTSGGSAGDGDGRVNPGEKVEVSLRMENVGVGETAYSVSCEVASEDPYVTVHQPMVDFGDIGPGASVWGQAACVLSVSSDCPNGHEAALSVESTDGSSHTWDNMLTLAVEAPDFLILEIQVDDSDQTDPNGLLDPGETGRLAITVRTEGHKDGSDIQAHLWTSDPNLDLIDRNADFGSIPVGNQGSNVDDPFEVSANLKTHSGHEAQFTLYLDSGSGMRNIKTFSLSVGVTSQSDPTGPDAYGYLAYDSGDWRYYDRPSYGWVEIDPVYGGSGTVLSLVDEPLPEHGEWADYVQGDTEVLGLPFTFRYYGKSYDEISVCSNGWLSMGSTWMTDFRNWSVPAVLSPPNIIAPFWDDLYLGDGHVVYSYDASGHRFVVAWSRVHNDYDDAVETFEVILHDPAYYETVTGDGEILFQYQDVSNIDYAWNFATVGIESPDKKGGVEYTYADLYSPGARELEDGMAIKFTTGSGVPAGVCLNYFDVQVDDDDGGGSDGDGDGLVDAGERIELRLRLINYGEEGAEDVTAELGSSDPNVTIQSSLGRFPDIASGDAVFGDEPCVFTVAADCEDGHIITFEVEMNASGLLPSYSSFNLDVVAPILVVEDGSLSQVEGDGDERPEAGETWELVITLKNVGGGQAMGVWGAVSADDAYFTLIEDRADFPDVAADSACANASHPFVFSVGAGATYHAVYLELSLFANNDHYTTVLDGGLVIERADILLVDDDGGTECEVYYVDALGGQGRSFEVYDRLSEGELDTSMLSEYWAVMWFTGAERDSTLTVSDQVSLKAYCHGGGNLFLSGQNIASDCAGTPFLEEYAHAEYVADSSGAIFLEGVSGDPISDGYHLLSLASEAYGANNQDSPDEVVCVGGSGPVLTYFGSGGIAGLRYRSDYMIVFYAVGFESMIDFYDATSAFAMRAEMLQRILNWFQTEPRVGDVNEDGAIDILDIVKVINVILSVGGDPTAFQMWASDCTGDDQVDILDVVGIVNVILGVGTCSN